MTGCLVGDVRLIGDVRLVGDERSDSNDTGNVRMRIIVHEFEVLVLEIEYALHFRIYLHLRQLARLA